MGDAATCDYCTDPQTRAHHLEQVSTHPTESEVLLRCPRCAALYGDSWRRVRHVTAVDAAAEFGWQERDQ